MITIILLICSSFLFLQFHNTRSQKGEKEKEAKQPDVPLGSDEEPADADADLSLMARSKRLAKEAKAAELRRQLAELDQEDSLSGSDVDPVQDHPPKDMGAFVAAAVSFFHFTPFYISIIIEILDLASSLPPNLSKELTPSMFF